MREAAPPITTYHTSHLWHQADEGEVGILESALSKLKSHQWGSDIVDHEV